MGKARKKDPALSSKPGKKKEMEPHPLEKKRKWQEYLNRHSTEKHLEEKS